MADTGLAPAVPGLRRLAAGIATAALLATAVADAGQVYRWTDAQGITHYGDRQPERDDVEVSTIPVS